MAEPVRRRLTAITVALAAALVAVEAGSAENGGFAPPDDASPVAERIADVYYLIAAFATLVFLVVTVPLVYFIVRYRGRGRPREIEGPQVRGNTKLELAWVAGPVLILTVIGAFVFYKLPGITDPADASANEFDVRIEGRRFYWQYEYPNGVVAIDRLRLPVGRESVIALTAPANDVIHSFWIPALGGKRDAIPGATTEFKYLPRKTGEFFGNCGEFCGIQHAAMLATAEVMPTDEFDRWLEAEARAQRAGTADLGAQIWVGVCAKCHGPDVAGKIGPELTGNPLLENREGLETIVRQGRGAMPPVGQGWSERQMNALLRFASTVIANQEREADGG